MNPRSIASTGLACTLAVALAAGLTSQNEPTAQAKQKHGSASSKHRKAKSKKPKRMCVYRVRSKRPSGWRKVKRTCKGKRAPAAPLTAVPGPPQSPSAAPVARCDREAWPNTPDAVQKLADSLRAGETGCLRPGIYTSSRPYVLQPTRSGITLRSHPDGKATLRGYDRIVNIPKGMDGITLDGLRIESTGGPQNTVGVYAANVTIQNSQIGNANKGRSCIMLGNNEGYGQAFRTIIRNNELDGCGDHANGNLDHGIYAANSLESQITGNTFTNTAAYAIQLYPNANKTLVKGNRIDGTGSNRGGIVIGSSGSYTSSGNLVTGNLIQNAATYGVTTGWEGRQGTDNLVERNCMTNNRAGDVSSQTGLRASSNLSGGSECMARLAQ